MTSMPDFLDWLPYDIHDHIAHQLFSSVNCSEDGSLSLYYHALKDDQILDSLLNYAKLHHAPRRSVLRAMSHFLYITKQWRKERILDWISLSANRLQRLDIADVLKFSFPGGPPSLPKLRRAHIATVSEHMSLIHGCPNLDYLNVTICSIKRWNLLVSTFGSLSLKTLNLPFANHSIGLKFPELSRFDLMSLSHACPTVETFYLNTGTTLTSEAWDMIKRMKSLRCLEVVGHIDDEHVPFVITLAELKLDDPRRIEDVTRFGEVITTLQIPLRDFEEMLELSSLPKLRSLRATLWPGCERYLHGLIDNIENLHLSWYYESCNDPETISDLPPGLRRDFFYPIYYEPDGAALKSAVRSAKQLKSLRIQCAILSSDILKELMKIVGNKMEELSIIHDWQKESAPDRMQRILKYIALYCPNLTSLNFLEWSSEKIVPILATAQQRKKCLKALDEVVRAVPGFSSFRRVKNIIEQRFTDEQPETILTWDYILPTSNN